FARSVSASAQSQSPRPRRGKNGEIVRKSPSTPSSSHDRQAGPQNAPAKTSPEPAPADEQADEMTNPDSVDQQPAATRDSRQTDTSSSQPSGETRRRKEPLPFDRPPLEAQTPSQAGTSGPATQPQTTPRRQEQPTTARQPEPRTNNGADRDADRSDRQQPVLRRSPDTYPGEQNRDGGNDAQNDEGRTRNKPILRRPADSSSPADTRGGDPDNSEPPRRNGGMGPQPTAEGDEVIKLDATLVNIPVLVSDRSGRYVPQLSEQDFIVYEDGVEQEVAFFGNERVPFHVVLLLDVSPSVQGSLQEIQAAALEFVRQMRSDDRIMIASFDRNVHYHTDFTNNRRVLESAIYSVDTGSGTSVYDAVYETVARRWRGIEGRKALILLSDGEDTTSSQASYDDAVDIVTESDVLVYGIRYPGTGFTVQTGPRINIPNWPFPLPFPWPMPRRRRGGNFSANLSNNAAQWPRRGGYNRDFMRDITEAGGGPVYDAERISDLSRLAARIAEELRHVYVVSYYPTNSLTNGGYRQIRIRIRGRSDIAVRHRKGYNARDLNARTGT
ncbi:MAG TPA: VWA domain-containing protein, partial [Blastocatellia bacterium]|nr:VWA domain-containing protein [Blastocatellia bacterium]